MNNSKADVTTILTWLVTGTRKEWLHQWGQTARGPRTNSRHGKSPLGVPHSPYFKKLRSHAALSLGGQGGFAVHDSVGSQEAPSTQQQDRKPARGAKPPLGHHTPTLGSGLRSWVCPRSASRASAITLPGSVASPNPQPLALLVPQSPPYAACLLPQSCWSIWARCPQHRIVRAKDQTDVSGKYSLFFSAITGLIYGWNVYIVMARSTFSPSVTPPPRPIYAPQPLNWLPVQDSGTEDRKGGERKIERHAKNNWLRGFMIELYYCTCFCTMWNKLHFLTQNMS